MKKLLLLTTILIPLSGNATNYVSITGEYIPITKAKGDISSDFGSAAATESFKNSFGGMLSAGRYITPDFRTELEVGYRELKTKATSIVADGTEYINNSSTKLKTFSGMGNVYYNFPLNIPVSPYVGGGIGMVRDNTDKANAFAYQLMTGIDYKLSDTSTVFMGYRYFQTTDFKYNYNIDGVGNVNTKASANIQAIDIGYRYNF